MFQIEPFEHSNIQSLVKFVSAIQEHERIRVPELKTGDEIGTEYALWLLKEVSTHDGVILFACADSVPIGFICGWEDIDEDLLLREDARKHAYVSDIYVSENWRGKGVGKALLTPFEMRMHNQGCKRVRVCSKATNRDAINFYQASSFSPYELIFTKPISEMA